MKPPFRADHVGSLLRPPALAEARRLWKQGALEADALRVLLPSLWFYEVGNTITRRFPRKAKAWLTTLENLALDEAPRTPRWLAVALSLADLHGVTFYDAAYHATALVHGGVFITADRRYVERAGEAGGVVALSDWTPA